MQTRASDWPKSSRLRLLLAAIAIICHGCKAQPLGEAPRLEFQQEGDPRPEIEAFLHDDFTIVKDLRRLPRSVLRAFTEEGGSRLVIVNPGKEFLETDVVYDSSLPNKRLIFAGVSKNKCFVHYEQGGFARFAAIALFTLKPNERLEPVRRTYCGPAVNLQDLRSQIANGLCSTSLIREMR
jgi:hypothetical protein